MKLTLKQLRQRIQEEVDRLVRNSAGFGGMSMSTNGQPPFVDDELEKTIGNDGEEQHEKPTQVGVKQKRNP